MPEQWQDWPEFHPLHWETTTTNKCLKLCYMVKAIVLVRRTDKLKKTKSLLKCLKLQIYFRVTMETYFRLSSAISSSFLYHLIVESLRTLKNWHHSFKWPEASAKVSPLILRITWGAEEKETQQRQHEDTHILYYKATLMYPVWQILFYYRY